MGDNKKSNGPELTKVEQQVNTPLLEWLAAGLGAAIVLFIVGYLAFIELKEDQTPPSVSAKVLKIIPNGSGFLVTIRAENKGARTAADLEIEGSLAVPGQEKESSSVTFSYLPSHSTREGGLFFTHNPHEGELTLRPVGYQVP